MTASNTPMTVVIVIDHAALTGGQAKVAFDSAIGLKAKGHHPVVFAWSGPVDRSLVEANIRVVCLERDDLARQSFKLGAAARGIWNPEAARALAGLLGSLPRGQTVVHVHGWVKGLSPSIAAPIRASGLPAVYTMHDYFLVCPNGGFLNYRHQTQCTLDPLSVACWGSNCDARSYTRKLWRNTRHALMNDVIGLPQVFEDIIGLSDFQIEKVARYLPRSARLHRVDNPIEATALGPKPDAERGDIIFVGRISPEKAPLLFAEAAAKVGIRPVFIGDGPEADELKARYPEAKVLGWQPAAEVRAHLRAARALVFPSLWYEGQPLIIQEAKSLGTPVVVSDGCAGREEIVDGVSGLWFHSGDAQDLAGALQRLASSDMTAMSQAAYDSFWSNPRTSDRHVAAITTIYAAALSRRRQPAGDLSLGLAPAVL